MLKWKGFLSALASSATFGLIPLFTLPLMAAGLKVPSILFYRFFISTLMMGVFLFVMRSSFRVTRKELLTLAGLSFLYDGSAIFLFWSYEYLASGIATTMMFLYPVFVALVMIVWFKEKNSFWTMAAIVLAVTGVALLSWNPGTGMVSITGLLLAVLSGLSYGIYIIAVNKSCVRDMASGKLTFYVFLFTALFLFAGAAAIGSLQRVPDWKCDLNLTLLALVPTVVSNLTLVAAIKSIGSTFSAVLGAMEPVTAMTVGVWVFAEPFTRMTAWGVALIILAVTLVVMAPSLEKGYRLGKLFYMTRVKKIHPDITPYH